MKGRRREAHQQSRHERAEHGHAEHPQIKSHRGHARQLLRQVAREHVDPAPREQHAQRRARPGQQQALNQERPGGSPAAGAERHAHRDIARGDGRLCQPEVGHVGARESDDQADGAQE
jgi:hypothetical protein